MTVQDFLNRFITVTRPVAIYLPNKELERVYLFHEECIADFGRYDVDYAEPERLMTYGDVLAIYIKDAGEP